MSPSTAARQRCASTNGECAPSDLIALDILFLSLQQNAERPKDCSECAVARALGRIVTAAFNTIGPLNPTSATADEAWRGYKAARARLDAYCSTCSRRTA